MKDGERIRLVNALLEDLNKLKKDKESSRLAISGTHASISLCPTLLELVGIDAALALGALKSLGKHPTGARILAQKDNLAFLLSLSDTYYKDNYDAALEALRCVANSMLLVEEARRTVISDDIKGGDISLRLLEVCFIINNCVCNAHTYLRRKAIHRTQYSWLAVYCS